MTTNRERLAKMTNEELANFLANTGCQYCIYDLDNCYDNDKTLCNYGILQWLNKECED